MSADTHAAMQAETVKLKAEITACRQLSKTMRTATLKQNAQWQRHRMAHKLFMAGKISQDERNRRWQLTIAAGDALDPLLDQAAEQWRQTCVKL